MSALTGEWERALHEEFSKEYYKNLFFFIRKQYSETIVYPKADEIFTAFHLTPLEKVKVVILGPRTLPRRPTRPIISGVVIRTSKSIQPSF